VTRTHAACDNDRLGIVIPMSPQPNKGSASDTPIRRFAESSDRHGIAAFARAQS
jgi:hypothetical protein